MPTHGWPSTTSSTSAASSTPWTTWARGRPTATRDTPGCWPLATSCATGGAGPGSRCPTWSPHVARSTALDVEARRPGGRRHRCAGGPRPLARGVGRLRAEGDNPGLAIPRLSRGRARPRARAGGRTNPAYPASGPAADRARGEGPRMAGRRCHGDEHDGVPRRGPGGDELGDRGADAAVRAAR